MRSQAENSSSTRRKRRIQTDGAPPQNPLIRTAHLLGVLEQLLDAVDTAEKETRVVISENYDPELLQLCKEVEDAMTSCMAVPALESFVNTEGVASLIEGHRLVVEATTPGATTIAKKGLKSRLQHLDPGFVPPAPTCHYYDLELAYFQTEKQQEQSLWTLEQFYASASQTPFFGDGEEATTCCSAALPTRKHGEEEEEEGVSSGRVPPSSCLACHTLFATLQILAKRILHLRDLWQQQQSSGEEESSKHNVLPADQHLLKTSAEVVAAISSSCLCYTEEALHFKKEVLIKDLSCLFLPLVEEALQHARKYASDLYTWRNSLADFHRDRCEELKQLGEWYAKSLEANSLWRSEEKRRSAFRAQFQTQVEALRRTMAEEQQKRDSFLQQYGAHLPMEGYPDALRPPSPVHVEVVLEAETSTILEQQQL